MTRVVLGLAAGLLAAACASPPPAPLSVRVHNRSGADVASISMKDCAGDEASFAPLPASELDPGRTVTIDLPDTCVDLVARDRRGRVVAEQRGLRALPGTTWTLVR